MAETLFFTMNNQQWDAQERHIIVLFTTGLKILEWASDSIIRFLLMQLGSNGKNKHASLTEKHSHLNGTLQEGHCAHPAL